jgi:hypothetical protein
MRILALVIAVGLGSSCASTPPVKKADDSTEPVEQSCCCKHDPWGNPEPTSRYETLATLQCSELHGECVAEQYCSGGGK